MCNDSRSRYDLCILRIDDFRPVTACHSLIDYLCIRTRCAVITNPVNANKNIPRRTRRRGIFFTIVTRKSLALSRLLDDAAKLLPVAFTGEGRLQAAFFAGRNVKGMTLDFTNDVFLLDFTLETAQRALEGLVISEADFCHDLFTCLSTGTTSVAALLTNFFCNLQSVRITRAGQACKSVR